MTLYKQKKGENTMTTIFSILFLIFAILATGSIEDCSGACMGQENWILFFFSLPMMIICGIMAILNQEQKD